MPMESMTKIYPASITKIMTAMLALKSGKLDDTVTITQENVTLRGLAPRYVDLWQEIRLPWISCSIVF